MKMKNSCTDQKCKLLTKCPEAEVCHQVGPLKVKMTPEPMIPASAAMVSTPAT